MIAMLNRRGFFAAILACAIPKPKLNAASLSTIPWIGQHYAIGEHGPETIVNISGKISLSALTAREWHIPREAVLAGRSFKLSAGGVVRRLHQPDLITPQM